MIEQEISRQQCLARWIDEHFRLPFSLESVADQVAFRSFDQVIEHHAACIVLAEAQLYGSLFALIRPQFEGMIRGYWLRHVASEEEIRRFCVNDEITSPFGELISKVEAACSINSKKFSQIKRDQWKIFCSFAHSGYQATARRVGGDTTGYGNYDMSEVKIALDYSGFFAVNCAMQLAVLSRVERLEAKTLERARLYVCG
jgi:hypothetical protein